jgi:putative CocE/NonD family hydrolase
VLQSFDPTTEVGPNRLYNGNYSREKRLKMRKFVYRASIVIGFIIIVAGTGFLARHEIQRYREGLPAFTHGEANRISEMVAMSDGTRLYTTISLPDKGEKFPAVLIRNPYAQFGTIMRDSICGRFARYGYACVMQDVRGQGKSEGEWSPGVYEPEDGRDTLNWLVEQSFQNGNIGMMGPSYLASVQWAAASAGLPPEVKTLIPAVYTTDNRGVMYQDGMFRHETFTAWASMMRGSNSEDDDAGAAYQAALKHRPHIEVDKVIFGTDLPWYRQMISAADPADPFWQEPETVKLRQTPEKLDIPILMVGGWYDVFLGPQFEDWQKLASKDKSRFIIGPWTHAGGGGEAFENPNSEDGLFQWPAMLDWFGHHLKGEPLKAKPGISTYVMREGTWRESQNWPNDTTRRDYYLTKLQDSKNCKGGQLSESSSQTPSSVQYTYDPNDPVPTRGGAGMLAFILPGFSGAKPANVWQEGLCEREDILSFTSDVFADAMTISGNIEVKLSVASSAEDTAFTAKLLEVQPDGQAVNIRDSITTLRIQEGVSQSYTPEDKVDITIRFWPIEWQIQSGSSLRLDISSSDFPKFHAHPNTAEPWALAETPIAAEQKLYSGQLTVPISK